VLVDAVYERAIKIKQKSWPGFHRDRLLHILLLAVIFFFPPRCRSGLTMVLDRGASSAE